LPNDPMHRAASPVPCPAPRCDTGARRHRGDVFGRSSVLGAAEPTGSPVEAQAARQGGTSVTPRCARWSGCPPRRMEASSQRSNGPSPPPAHLGAPVRRERLPRQHASAGRPTSSEEGSPERSASAPAQFEPRRRLFGDDGDASPVSAGSRAASERALRCTGARRTPTSRRVQGSSEEVGVQRYEGNGRSDAVRLLTRGTLRRVRTASRETRPTEGALRVRLGSTAGNAANLKAGSGVQQTRSLRAEEAVEVVRNHEDGTRCRRVVPAIRRRLSGASGSGRADGRTAKRRKRARPREEELEITDSSGIARGSNRTRSAL